MQDFMNVRDASCAFLPNHSSVIREEVINKSSAIVSFYTKVSPLF